MYSSVRNLNTSVHNPINELLVTFRYELDGKRFNPDGWEEYLTAEFYHPTFDVCYTWGELRHARRVLSRLAALGG